MSYLPDQEIRAIKKEFPVGLVEKTVKSYLSLYIQEYMKESEFSEKHEEAVKEWNTMSKIPKFLLKKESLVNIPETLESIIIGDNEYAVSLEIVPKDRVWSDELDGEENKEIVSNVRGAVSMIFTHAVNYWEWFVMKESKTFSDVKLKLRESNLTIAISGEDHVREVIGPVVKKM